MNIFLTSGTMDFMESVRKRYANETDDCYARWG